MKFSAWAQGYICGAVTRSEGKRLARLAANVQAGEAIVELGSHGGSSTSWLAMGAHRGDGAHVYAIDPWDFAAGERLDQHSESAVFRRWQAQIDFMASAGYLDASKVHPVQGYSTAVAESWDRPVGLLHIDALHTYEAVTADIEAWVPHLAPGAVVVMHDWSNRKMGVRRAGTELARRPGWRALGRHEGDRHRGKHGQLVVQAP